ncbi:hypothetical protein DVH24_019666 [Malus domestica]|uniref:Uncharacterized protein n=1 Tax=Malus domestica TaxID=3750 RepID=A0A498HYT7_MALDO|nr:hypothetical protein DVH24_019666 [Malus domestica]
MGRVVVDVVEPREERESLSRKRVGELREMGEKGRVVTVDKLIHVDVCLLAYPPKLKAVIDAITKLLISFMLDAVLILEIMIKDCSINHRLTFSPSYLLFIINLSTLDE